MILGTGIDIVENDRIRDSLSRFSDRFLRRVFTEEEQKYCLSLTDNIASLAARFALKEAYIKALGIHGFRGLSYREIELAGEKFGPKTIRTYGNVLLADNKIAVKKRHFSISHERHYSIAFVVLE